MGFSTNDKLFPFCRIKIKVTLEWVQNLLIKPNYDIKRFLCFFFCFKLARTLWYPSLSQQLSEGMIIQYNLAYVQYIISNGRPVCVCSSGIGWGGRFCYNRLRPLTPSLSLSRRMPPCDALYLLLLSPAKNTERMMRLIHHIWYVVLLILPATIVILMKLHGVPATYAANSNWEEREREKKTPANIVCKQTRFCRSVCIVAMTSRCAHIILHNGPGCNKYVALYLLERSALSLFLFLFLTHSCARARFQCPQSRPSSSSN